MLFGGPNSHTGTQYMDFLEMFNVSQVLPTVQFGYLSEC